MFNFSLSGTPRGKTGMGSLRWATQLSMVRLPKQPRHTHSFSFHAFRVRTGQVYPTSVLIAPAQGSTIYRVSLLTLLWAGRRSGLDSSASLELDLHSVMYVRGCRSFLEQLQNIAVPHSLLPYRCSFAGRRQTRCNWSACHNGVVVIDVYQKDL
jgi:hypothetical protein